MIKICFISFNSYPLFAKKSLDYFGGAEVQISRLARYLARDRRFSVSLVVADYGQKPKIKVGRLIIHTGMRRFFLFQIEVLRFLLTLKKINADVYMERTLNLKVGLVCLFCKLFKKKFVYMLAHDWDTQPNHGHFLKWWEKISFDFGLKSADLIIAQTENQKLSLKNNFGLKSVVIRSLAVKPAKTKIFPRRFFLWVGRSDQWKQPEKFLHLAKSLPREKFVFVCREGRDHEYFLKIKELTKKLTNLTHLTVIPFEDIADFFSQAKALVNTSIAEGFPNTFLQAGMAKMPIVSLKVNPDNFITKYNCGIWANNNFSRLVRACQNIKTDMGNNNFLYVKRFHYLANAEKLGQILLNHFGRPAA